MVGLPGPGRAKLWAARKQLLDEAAKARRLKILGPAKSSGHPNPAPLLCAGCLWGLTCAFLISSSDCPHHPLYPPLRKDVLCRSATLSVQLSHRNDNGGSSERYPQIKVYPAGRSKIFLGWARASLVTLPAQDYQGQFLSWEGLQESRQTPKTIPRKQQISFDLAGARLREDHAQSNC